MYNLKDNESISPEEFNWGPYESGYDGGDRLVENTSVDRHGNDKDKVYCHEEYAQELYDGFCRYFEGSPVPLDAAGKDVATGKVFAIVGITPVSDHEVMVDTADGGSARIDMDKERDYLSAMGIDDVGTFMSAIAHDEYREAFIEDGVACKVMKGGRFSLWDGHLSKIEAELMKQVVDKDAKKYAYEATIESINGGGYIVNVSGIRCFLPGSLAAPGVINDFDTMLGKKLMVMVVNYMPTSGFVVSYKKYLSMIMPSKIKDELSIGQKVLCQVTGSLQNGMFVQFRDKDGEWIFSGFIHRSAMTRGFERDFDDSYYMVGDQIYLYIANFVEKNGTTRIILTDRAPRKERE